MSETLNQKNVLIAEDEADLREPIALELESLGCKVFQASNGKEGLEIVKREPIDCVISDMRMPGGDGIELLNGIKDIDVFRPTVMLITGYSDLSREEAYNLGADFILPKPFDLDEIISVVEKVIQNPAERWKQKPSLSNLQDHDEHIEKTFEEACEQDLIALGRGGIYIKSASKKWTSKQNLRLEISFDQGDSFFIKGLGRVLWAHKTENGCESGIEFLSLDESCYEQVVKKIAEFKPRAYIPKKASR